VSSDDPAWKSGFIDCAMRTFPKVISPWIDYRAIAKASLIIFRKGIQPTLASWMLD
jgi:hypothetical protein